MINLISLQYTRLPIIGIFIKLFEYNSKYWTADYAALETDSSDPRCKTLCTPKSESDDETPDYGSIYSTEIHHVRAVFDFTDLAEPWPNN